MSFKDEIMQGVEDAARDVAIDGIARGAKWLATHFLGASADDSAAGRIARKALEAATEQAQNEAFLLAGGDKVIADQLGELPARAQAILDAFQPKVAPTPPDHVEIVCTLRSATWEAMSLDLHVDPPLADDPPWIVARVDGIPVSVADDIGGNREARGAIAAWLDAHPDAA